MRTRRRFSGEFRAKVVLEAIQEHQTRPLLSTQKGEIGSLIQPRIQLGQAAFFNLNPGKSTIPPFPLRLSIV